MGKCAEAGIGLAFCSPHGRFLARTCGESSGNVLLRREQYRIADDPARSCEIARTMIFGKLSNGAASIQRTLRDHAPRVADCGLEEAAACRRGSCPSWILRKTVCAFTIWGSNMRKKWSISVRRAPICQRIP